jgi:hydroxymethylbilane synthase
MSEQIRIGTRGSKLALWQANHITNLLRETHPGIAIDTHVISTKGDEILDKPLPAIGGKGLFTAALEDALRDGRVDCAVHSLKDLPTENAAGLTVGAIPPRGPVGDVLVSRAGETLDALPAGATVGTSSRRRAAQLNAYRADLDVIDVRGNVPTRIQKCLDPTGLYDAIVLAQAGVMRLDLHNRVSETLPFDVMLPAPGQGAIGVQCRADDNRFTPLTDPQTQLAVTAERAFLNTLGGGCAVPVAAYARIEADQLHLHGRVISVDGTQIIDLKQTTTATLEAARTLGKRMASDMLAQGADTILAAVR